MKIVSWNVNGFRSILTKNFNDFFTESDADIFCIQETKMQEDQVEVSFDGYYQYFTSAEKKGYSGVAFFTKHEPLNVMYGIDAEDHPMEGRSITLEYTDFYVVGVYTPNSQENLKRIDYRAKWEDDLLVYLNKLNEDKPVILCGDLNVAHNEIDLFNPKGSHNSPGFSEIEREKMTNLLDNGFVDVFRHLYPYTENAYTWWSYRTRGRSRNDGWRIDYFIVSEDMIESVKDMHINNDIMGSDHCPVTLILEEDHLEI